MGWGLPCALSAQGLTFRGRRSACNPSSSGPTLNVRGSELAELNTCGPTGAGEERGEGGASWVTPPPGWCGADGRVELVWRPLTLQVSTGAAHTGARRVDCSW